MKRVLEPRVPPLIQRVLTDPDLSAQVGVTFELVTVDADGWPCATMLSVGELVVSGDELLTLAVHAGRTAATNLSGTRQALLITVIDETLFYLRLRVGEGVALGDAHAGDLTSFAARVEQVTVDEVPYAEVVTGTRFRLHDEGSVRERWAHTRALLQAQAPRAAGW